MKIVITDGYTLNPGDLSWDHFSKLGSVQYFDRTAPVEVIERCYNADIIVTNKTLITTDVIDAASHLKLIAVTATGYNNIAVGAAREKGIPVCNVPGYGTDSVAQHVFALLLELTNHTGKNAASVQRGDWAGAADWCYSLQPITELSNKVFGIIGMGKIGNRVAQIAQAFGMQVLYHGGNNGNGYPKEVSLYEVFMQSDVISLHCPLTEKNARFVNKELLGIMKPSAVLINTARGGLINEKDLVEVLLQRRIAGAALDVLSAEPPPANHPLTGLNNCIITPHNAWMSQAARQRVMDVTAENIIAFRKGHIQNCVY